MNTVHLRYFVETVNCGSINKAAAKLYLNHSSLVYAINELEKEIGEKLLIRNKTGVVLTDVGKMVFEDAPKIFAMMDTWVSKSDKVDLLLEAVPCIFFSYLKDIVLQLGEKFPALRLSTQLTLPYQFVANSICLSGYESSDENKLHHLLKASHSVSIPLFKSKYVLYLNRQNPLACQDFCQTWQVKNLHIYATAHQTIENSIFYQLYDTNHTSYVPSLPDIMKMIASHTQGATVLPAHLKYFPDIVDPQKVTVLSIKDFQEYFYIFLAYPTGFLERSRLMKSVIDFLAAYPYTENIASDFI